MSSEETLDSQKLENKEERKSFRNEGLFKRPKIPFKIDYEILGSGGYGKVYKVNENTIMKRVSENDNDLGIESPLEIYIMSYMKFPTLSKAEKYTLFDNGVVDIYQKMAFADLKFFSKKYMVKNPEPAPKIQRGPVVLGSKKIKSFKDPTPIKSDLKRNIAIKIIWDVCLALHYLHNNNIIHGDVKTSNVLLYDDDSGDLFAKLADFSLSVYMPNGFSHINSHSFYSAPYKPPEIWGKSPWSFEADIWALGVTIYSLIYSKTLFIQKGFKENTQNQFNILNQRIWDNKMRYPDVNSLSDNDNINIDESWEYEENYIINNLILKMLRYNPNDRLDISGVLNHEIFDDLRVKKFNSIKRVKNEYYYMSKPNKYMDIVCDRYICNIATHIQEIDGSEDEKFIYLITAFKITTRKVPKELVNIMNYSDTSDEIALLKRIDFNFELI